MCTFVLTIRTTNKGNMKGMTDKGIPPELFNQLK